MPTIYDNDKKILREGLLTAYRESLPLRADCCIGYFNLRGWGQLADTIDSLPGSNADENGTTTYRVCRLLIGMMIQNFGDSLKLKDKFPMDNTGINRQKELLAAEFRQQLERGYPSNTDEKTLKLLQRQLQNGKVCIKLYLRYPLHAKLYLAHRSDSITPIVAFIGSSNLTLAGLKSQGELNVDVVEQDAARKLDDWFNKRWNDSKCVDISQALIKVLDAGIDQSPR